ncbi:TPA: hypothetical protein ACYSAU_004182 [Klebsiella variicola]
MVVDNELVVIIFRGTDRLLITIGGVISIWLGYKLFSKALPNNGTFDGGIGSWSVRMQNIAPGVFFALFGASALIFSISHPLNYEKRQHDGSSATTQLSPSTQKGISSIGNGQLANNSSTKSTSDTVFSGIAADKVPNLDSKIELDLLNALAVINKYRNRSAESLTPEQTNKINLSYSKLYSFQIYLINKLFGQGSFDKYLNISSEIRDNPEKLKNLPKEDKILYESIKSLYEQ